MGVGYNPKIVANGLLFCLDAANRKSYPGSGTSCYDLIRNFNGTLVNSPTYSSTEVGGTFTFTDTSSQYISFGDIFDNTLSVGFTFQAWIKVTDYSRFNRIFVINNTSTGYQYWIQTNQTIGTIQSGTLNTTYTDGLTAVGTTNWVNIASTCSYGASSFKIYLNGIDDTGTHTGTPAYTANVGTTFIGRLGTTGYSNFKLSNIQVYNRALSAEEIRQNFNALRGRFGV